MHLLAAPLICFDQAPIIKVSVWYRTYLQNLKESERFRAWLNIKSVNKAKSRGEFTWLKMSKKPEPLSNTGTVNNCHCQDLLPHVINQKLQYLVTILYLHREIYIRPSCEFWQVDAVRKHFDWLSPAKTVGGLKGHIKATGKGGLRRLVSFGLHLSLHIQPRRLDRVTATHISKQQSSAPRHTFTSQHQSTQCRPLLIFLVF